MNKHTYLLLLLLVIAVPAKAQDWAPERRDSQIKTQSGYFVVPLPYSLPGIGSGVVFLGNMANINETTADVNVVSITGDAGGTMLLAEEVPLAGNWLNLEYFYQNISRANVNVYSKRGMEGTGKDDFNIMEIGLFKKLSGALIFNFYDKRFNIRYGYEAVESRVDALKDNQGELIDELNSENKDKQSDLTLQVDLTDDYFDPRRGGRFDLRYQNHRSKDGKSADFYTLDYSLFGYIPFGKHSTLALNYFQSDAHVKREGETDLTAIRNEVTLNCDIADVDCLQAEDDLVSSYYNQRKFGTAADMGGDQRLRAYPGSRFQGAHSAYIGAEFRWNFVQEATPFNYWIWRDVRTGYQTAFFFEAATVSEVASELWDNRRYSAGVGFRLITASGGVYRADFARGDEGTEVTILFNYPW